MARRNNSTPVSVTNAGEESAQTALEPVAPEVAPTLAEQMDACLTSEARLATLTLSLHSTWRAYDTASKAYDKARVRMVTAGIPAARVAAQLFQYAVTDKAFHAERGVNAGKPAVEKMATHLGYERRRFEPILKAGLALLEAKVTLAPEDEVTPEDLEIAGPHLSKDAARKAKARAAAKETETAPPAGDDEETEETAGLPAVTPPAGNENVVLADVIAAIAAAQSIAEKFAAGHGLTREAFDAVEDALSTLSTTLEAVVADK